MAHDHQHDDQHHDHEHRQDHGHHHGHGHHHDRGWKAVVRYLRHGPRMWSSEINDMVIDLADPKPGERALDIGAGMGPGATLAAKRGARVVAVEPTPFLRTVLAARSRLFGNGGRIQVCDGSAERLPVDDDSIDVVWAVNSMHHWVDPDAAVLEIVRVLKPGARLVLVDEDFANANHPDNDPDSDPNNDPDDPDSDQVKDTDDNSDSESSGGPGHGPERHGFTMVDVERLGAQLVDLSLANVEAGERLLGTRPVFAITADVP